MKRQSYEDGLQEACADYCRAMRWLFCHVANERKCSLARGWRLKRQGVSAGVPDLLIFEHWLAFDPNPGITVRGFGVAAELKSPRGVVSKDQQKWLDELEWRGWLVEVVRTIDQFVALTDAIPRNA